MENESEDKQEESRRIEKSNSEQTKDEQWEDVMRSFSNKVTEIEAYARKQSDFLHTISEVTKQTQENLKTPQEEKLEETKKEEKKDDTEIGYEEK